MLGDKVPTPGDKPQITFGYKMASGRGGASKDTTIVICVFVRGALRLAESRRKTERENEENRDTNRQTVGLGPTTPTPTDTHISPPRLTPYCIWYEYKHCDCYSKQVLKQVNH